MLFRACVLDGHFKSLLNGFTFLKLDFICGHLANLPLYFIHLKLFY